MRAQSYLDDLIGIDNVAFAFAHFLYGVSFNLVLFAGNIYIVDMYWYVCIIGILFAQNIYIVGMYWYLYMIGILLPPNIYIVQSTRTYVSQQTCIWGFLFSTGSPSGAYVMSLSNIHSDCTSCLSLTRLLETSVPFLNLMRVHETRA